LSQNWIFFFLFFLTFWTNNGRWVLGPPFVVTPSSSYFCPPFLPPSTRAFPRPSSRESPPFSRMPSTQKPPGDLLNLRRLPFLFFFFFFFLKKALFSYHGRGLVATGCMPPSGAIRAPPDEPFRHFRFSLLPPDPSFGVPSLPPLFFFFFVFGGVWWWGVELLGRAHPSVCVSLLLVVFARLPTLLFPVKNSRPGTAWPTPRLLLFPMVLKPSPPSMILILPPHLSLFP